MSLDLTNSRVVLNLHRTLDELLAAYVMEQGKGSVMKVRAVDLLQWLDGKRLVLKQVEGEKPLADRIMPPIAKDISGLRDGIKSCEICGLFYIGTHHCVTKKLPEDRNNG